MSAYKMPFFKKFLIFSIVAHSLLFVTFSLTSTFKVLKPKTRILWVEIPRGASEKLDIKIKESKGLPKTTIKEQKEAAKLQTDEEAKQKKEKPPVVREQKKKLRPIQPEPRPKMRQVKPKQKADWEKALAKLEKVKPAVPEAAQVKDKGEGFKYGTGTNPLKVPPSDPEYIEYQAKIRHRIIQEWILPLAYLEGGNPPRATIVVYINRQGNITSQEWEYRSGNGAFDSSCARAVQRASPLPIPPEKLEWEAYNEGFLVEFDPSLKMM